MIERKIVAQKKKEFEIEEFISKNMKNIGHSHTKVQRNPLGEKIVVSALRPGLVVGQKGQNIKKLTMDLKKKFDLSNPQIEISEVEEVNLDANIVADRISSALEKFGSVRFKAIGHKIMGDVMNAGALGVEIIISGKIPSSRAKSWRFYQGYLKKCGDISLSGVNKAYAGAKLKTGIVGIKVSIMPPTIKLPDKIELLKEKEEVLEEIEEGKDEKKKEEGKEQEKEEKGEEKRAEKGEGEEKKDKEKKKAGKKKKKEEEVKNEG